MRKVWVRAVVACLLCACAVPAVAANASKASVTVKITEVNVHGNVWLGIKPATFSSKGFSISDIVTVRSGGYKATMPICKDYSDVSAGEPLVRLSDDGVCIAINMGNFARAAGVSEGDTVTITMKQQYGYLTQYHTHLLKELESRSQVASDEAFANFRQVAGGSIAEGRLYRSASPAEGNERASYAARLMEQAGIACVVNLHDAEPVAAQEPEYYAHLDAEGNVLYCAMGVSYTDADFAPAVRRCLEYIAQNDGPCLVHAKNGIQRTGLVVAIIQALCGATLQQVTDDYMRSFENWYGIAPGSTQYAELAKTVGALFASLNGGKPVTDKNLQKVTEKYLVQAAGMTQAQVNAVRSRLE